MQEILSQIARIRGVGGCAVLSADGLPVATHLRNDVDEDALSANLADLVGRCFRVCQHLDLHKPRSLSVHSEDGGLVILAAGPGYIALAVDPGANLALLQLEVRPLVDAIVRALTL